MLQLLFIVKFFVSNVKGNLIISSYPVLVDGRRVSGVPLNYSIPGHACATPAHAAVHSIPEYKKETAVPFLYLKRDTNTGGAEVPLSCNNIRWNT